MQQPPSAGVGSAMPGVRAVAQTTALCREPPEPGACLAAQCHWHQARPRRQAAIVVQSSATSLHARADLPATTRLGEPTRQFDLRQMVLLQVAREVKGVVRHDCGRLTRCIAVPAYCGLAGLRDHPDLRASRGVQRFVKPRSASPRGCGSRLRDTDVVPITRGFAVFLRPGMLVAAPARRSTDSLDHGS